METGFFQWCPMIGQETVDTNSDRNFYLNIRKTFYCKEA